jgi:hypothetical protein
MAIHEYKEKVASASGLSIDFIAVAIALALAGLIRLNILPQIRW